ncbi:hypothetical protein MJD09_05125 [bacterium]|nr:hypothetical protein [bacterium]
MTTDTNKPADTLRDGSVRATIWPNQTEKGTFHSVTLDRTYTDADGNVKNTHSFSGADLLKVSRLAEQAYDRVGQIRQAEKAAALAAERESTGTDQGVEK